ncbi:uncharacterized protein LOC127645164 [Xyrauchen texanus]|uniref:uncharacterized protein LOC127645164 n=1 Tax=Xyrauchen texanus TaxID=154827 RepID=UPI002241DF14|nr:uncharacterized protein LOC127645164 [Xyrauchen texanus]
MKLCLHVLLCSFVYYSFANVITPVQNEMYSEEGENVTLSCNYSSANTLQWYRQYPASAPEYLFIILHATGKVSQKSEFVTLDTRFSGKVNEKKVILEISPAKVTDSALYYCALTPTAGKTLSVKLGIHITDHWEKQQMFDLTCTLSTAMFAFILILLTLTEGNRARDVIMPYSDAIIATESENVTLSCNYTGSVDSLHWSRQYTGLPPQFLILDYSGFINEARPPVSGISIKHRKESTSVDLEICSAAVSDSALYYCALQPTVTGKTLHTIKNTTQQLTTHNHYTFYV